MITNHLPNCYDNDQLEKAVTGNLADSDLDLVIAHVGQCHACQSRYEALLLSDVNLVMRPRPSRSGPNDDLDKILERTKTANDWINHHDVKHGRFRIIRKIGQGGMGELFECFDEKLSRVVALKKIRPDRFSPNLLNRLKKEATIQAGLNHPCIVQVYEVGVIGGVPYIAMEYIAGGSLRDLIRDRPLVPTEAARLVAKIAAAVHQAHQTGVLHRDLKPSNILIMATNDPKQTGIEPKIADFGLAKLIGDENGGDLSATTIVIGTPTYLSPEQAANRADMTGPLSDIYSLGVILYECLTGHPPFNADNNTVLIEMIKEVEPVSPRNLVPGIGRDIETICLKCLSKEPTRRYADALSLAEDLNRFVEGRPILARRAGRLETAWRWSLRNSRLAASLAIIVAMTFLFSGYAFWSANSQKRLRILAEAETLRANRSEAAALEQRDKAYRYLLAELQQFRKIVVMLDNPQIKLAHWAEIVKIQASIDATVQEEIRRLIADRYLVEEKPEILLEALDHKASMSKMSGKPQEEIENYQLAMDIFPKIKNPTPSIIRTWIGTADLLANKQIGNDDLPAALHAWGEVWKWYKSGDRRRELNQPEVRDVFRRALAGYRVFLMRANRMTEAEEVGRELTRLELSKDE